jgi:pilus assembly protein CpaB
VRNKNPLVLSVLAGVLAALMMWIYVNRRESQLLGLSAMKDVIVVTKDVPENTVLDETLVQQIQVPSRYLQPQTITDVRDVIGRVTAVPIPKSAQILGSSLLGERKTALSFAVPRGRRAVTIAVSDVTGVAGMIRPGNFVDIVGIFQYGRPIGEQNGRVQYADQRTEVYTMMQNVLVIAVGQEHESGRPAPKTAEQLGTEQEGAAQPAKVNNVTVLVPPQQVQELVLAQQVGELTLALRSDLDVGESTDLPRLDPMGLLKVQIPVKPRDVPIWREIRGAPGS